MSSDNAYQGQPGPYGQGGQGGSSPGPYGYPQGGPPPGPYGYPQPNIPPEDAGYAFGPFAPQPSQGPAGPPPGPMPGPTPQPTGPRHRGRGLVILAVIALALLLVGVIAILAVWPTLRVGSQPIPSQAPGSATSSAPPTSAPPPATLASDAASGYLNALAAGHAAAALAYSDDPVKPGPFLTDKVLAESIKRAPLTAIQVPPVTDQQATHVAVTYRLGKTNVSTSYDVVKASGVWKLAKVSKIVDLTLVRSSSTTMLINGVKVNSDTVDLLPGSYAFTTASPNLTYGSKNVLVLTDPNAYADVLNLRPSLSDRGRKTVTSLANKSYDACLRTTVPRPRNCPFIWTNSVYRFRSGSVTWRQLGDDPFKNPKVQLSGPSAQVSIGLRVRISGPCTVSGSAAICAGRVTGTGVASIRLDRGKLSVVWLL